jgi:hypothetical protein
MHHIINMPYYTEMIVYCMDNCMLKSKVRVRGCIALTWTRPSLFHMFECLWTLTISKFQGKHSECLKILSSNFNFIAFFRSVTASPWPHPCQTGSDIIETGVNFQLNLENNTFQEGIFQEGIIPWARVFISVHDECNVLIGLNLLKLCIWSLKCQAQFKAHPTMHMKGLGMNNACYTVRFVLLFFRLVEVHIIYIKNSGSSLWTGVN